MKARLTGRDRNGLIFIQAMTLWRDQEALRNMAPTESHQVSMGCAKNSQNLLFVSDEDRGEWDWCHYTLARDLGLTGGG